MLKAIKNFFKTFAGVTFKGSEPPAVASKHEQWYYTGEMRWVPTGQRTDNYVRIRRQYKLVSFESGREKWDNGDIWNIRYYPVSRVVPKHKLSEYGIQE